MPWVSSESGHYLAADSLDVGESLILRREQRADHEVGKAKVGLLLLDPLDRLIRSSKDERATIEVLLVVELASIHLGFNVKAVVRIGWHESGSHKLRVAPLIPHHGRFRDLVALLFRVPDEDLLREGDAVLVRVVTLCLKRVPVDLKAVVNLLEGCDRWCAHQWLAHLGHTLERVRTDTGDEH